jgi:hypothetical protein
MRSAARGEPGIIAAVLYGASFPSGCKTESDLTPSELVFLYTLFENLSCLQEQHYAVVAPGALTSASR